MPLLVCSLCTRLQQLWGCWRSTSTVRIVKTNLYNKIFSPRKSKIWLSNLVPTVSLSPPPRAREERPWLGLVTCLLDKSEHKGGVLKCQVFCRVVVCRFQNKAITRALRPPLNVSCFTAVFRRPFRIASF